MASDAMVNLSLLQYKEIEKEIESLKNKIEKLNLEKEEMRLENIDLKNSRKKVVLSKINKTVDYLIFDTIKKYKNETFEKKLSILDEHFKSYNDIPDDFVSTVLFTESEESFINFDDCISKIRIEEENKVLKDLQDLKDSIKLLKSNNLELESINKSNIKKVENEYQIKLKTINEDFNTQIKTLDNTHLENIKRLKKSLKDKDDQYNYYVEQIKNSDYTDDKLKEKDSIIISLTNKLDGVSNIKSEKNSFLKFINRIFK